MGGLFKIITPEPRCLQRTLGPYSWLSWQGCLPLPRKWSCSVYDWVLWAKRRQFTCDSSAVSWCLWRMQWDWCTGVVYRQRKQWRSKNVSVPAMVPMLGQIQSWSGWHGLECGQSSKCVYLLLQSTISMSSLTTDTPCFTGSRSWKVRQYSAGAYSDASTGTFATLSAYSSGISIVDIDINTTVPPKIEEMTTSAAGVRTYHSLMLTCLCLLLPFFFCKQWITRIMKSPGGGDPRNK